MGFEEFVANLLIVSVWVILSIIVGVILILDKYLELKRSSECPQPLDLSQDSSLQQSSSELSSSQLKGNTTENHCPIAGSWPGTLCWGSVEKIEIPLLEREPKHVYACEGHTLLLEIEKETFPYGRLDV